MKDLRLGPKPPISDIYCQAGELLVQVFFVCVLGLFRVLIWNHHPNIRLDDPIIQGSDLYTINRALDFRLDDPRDAMKTEYQIILE